jgi:hypothetical protein
MKYGRLVLLMMPSPCSERRFSLDSQPQEPSPGPVAFRSISVPASLADGILAVTKAVNEDGQPASEVADLLLLIGKILSYRVPLCDRPVPVSLVRTELLRLYYRQLVGLDSDIDLRLLTILSDAGLAHHFITGHKIAIQYHDRPGEDNWGETTPDSYCGWRKLAIYADTKDFHSSPDARVQDYGVNCGLTHRGIIPLRVTSGMIIRDPMAVARMVLAYFRPKSGKGPDASKGRRDAA